MAKVRLNRTFLRRLSTWGPVADDMEKRADRVATIARFNGPMDTGDYVSSIEARPLLSRPGAWRVIAKDRKAALIEWGSRPHEIRPKSRRRGRKRALWWEGAPYPVSRVRHPGTAPTYNMAEALQLGARGVTRIS